MRVRIKGKIFETVAEAAEYHGVSKKSIYKRAARGTLDDIGVTHRHYGKKTYYKGLYFSSLKNMSDELGLHYASVLVWSWINNTLDKKAEKMPHISCKRLGDNLEWYEVKRLPMSEDVLSTLAVMFDGSTTAKIRAHLLDGKSVTIGMQKFVVED